MRASSAAIAASSRVTAASGRVTVASSEAMRASWLGAGMAGVETTAG
jgi:hypothetical protein